MVQIWKIVRTKLGDFVWKMKGGLFGNKMARFDMNQNLYWQILEVVLRIKENSHATRT